MNKAKATASVTAERSSESGGRTPVVDMRENTMVAGVGFHFFLLRLAGSRLVAST